MSEQQPPLKMLYLWSLAVRGGSEWLKDLKPALECKDRRPLLTAGLIEENRETRLDGARPIRVKRVSLTDRGWRYLRDRMTAPVNARSYAAADVLQQALVALSRHLSASDLTLAEIFGPAAAPAVVPVWERLRAEWDRLAMPGGGVRLAVLRREFADVARADLDRALLSLQREGKLVLYPQDDPEAIASEDAAAALSAAGRPMHLAFLKTY